MVKSKAFEEYTPLLDVIQVRYHNHRKYQKSKSVALLYGENLDFIRNVLACTLLYGATYIYQTRY